MESLPRTVFQGYKDLQSRLQHVNLFYTCALPIYLQACHGVPQPIVENDFTPTPGPPLPILLENLSRLIVRREAPLYLSLLVVIILAPNFVPVERSFGLVREVAEQREGIVRALHVMKRAQVPRSVLAHLAKMHKAETARKAVVLHATLYDAETLLSQGLFENRK